MGTACRTLEPPRLYRPRNARASPLYQLLETYYEEVKAIWEQRFEKKYGFWRGWCLRHSLLIGRPQVPEIVGETAGFKPGTLER